MCESMKADSVPFQSLTSRAVVAVFVGHGYSWQNPNAHSHSLGPAPIPFPVMIQLARYTAQGFDRGASRLKEVLWLAVKWGFFQTSVPWPSDVRCALLRAFGASVGNGVVIRGNVNISFPWRVSIGDDVWLGEEVMILSLAQVTIERNVCVSQRAFLCTGSHDHSKETFDLITKPITLREGSWVAAMAFIGPGVEVGRGSRVAASAMVSREVPPFVVVQGNPAAVVKELPNV